MAYIGLLVLFTYTPVVLVGLREDVSFWDSYIKSQSNFFSLFVNIGLLLLLVIDYEPGQSFAPKNLLFGTIIAIMLAVVIAGLAYNCQIRHLDLIWVFDKSWFVLLLHTLFILYLMRVKYMTLKSSERELQVEKKF